MGIGRRVTSLPIPLLRFIIITIILSITINYEKTTTVCSLAYGHFVSVGSVEARPVESGHTTQAALGAEESLGICLGEGIA